MPCELIDLPRVPDERGNLTFIEGAEHVPFVIKRAFWIYGTPGGESRGGHAYRKAEEAIIALSGSFTVTVEDSSGAREVRLSRGYSCLYVPPLTWRSLSDFSTNAVCLILASTPYDEADYVRSLEEFQRLSGQEG